MLEATGIIKLTGEGATSQWEASANWSAKGTIDTLPDLPLLVLFRAKDGQKLTMSHTGLYVGSAEMIHAKGHAVGVVKEVLGTQVSMTHWAIPKGAYTDEEILTAGVVDMTSMRYGSKGDDVKELQIMLNALGVDSGNADGIFGSATQAAVIRFQQLYGLTADGIAGAKTMEKLRALMQREEPEQDPVVPDELIITNNEEAVRCLLALLKYMEGDDTDER